MSLKLIDMRKTSQEKAEECMPMALGSVNEYPYGLCIRLTEEELDRSGIDPKDLTVGDLTISVA